MELEGLGVIIGVPGSLVFIPEAVIRENTIVSRMIKFLPSVDEDNEDQTPEPDGFPEF